MSPLPGDGPDEPPHRETPEAETVLVRASCPPDFIETLTPDAGFGRMLRPGHMRDTLLHIAGRPTGEAVLAVLPEGRIVGYLLLDRPEPVVWQGRTFHARWEQCQVIWVLGSIEVNQSHRGQGLSTRMLAAAFDGGRYDDRIVVAEAMRWHWDLAGAGLTAQAYRRRLLGLLERFGFQEFPTDAPEVRADEANALVARLGARVAPEHVRHFHALRYVSRRAAGRRPS